MLVAVATTDGRVFHLQEVFTAPTTDLHALHQAQQSLADMRVQNQVRAGIGPQDVRHRTCLAQAGSPGRRLPVALD